MGLVHKLVTIVVVGNFVYHFKNKTCICHFEGLDMVNPEGVAGIAYQQHLDTAHASSTYIVQSGDDND